MLSQFLDRVAAVTQNALITVNIGDGRGRGCGVDETGVVGDRAGFLQELGNVITGVAFCSFESRQFNLSAVVAQECARGISHGVPFMR